MSATSAQWRDNVRSRIALQGFADRHLAGWDILDVHCIPEHFQEGTEIDFYCCNEHLGCLLRLRSAVVAKCSLIEEPQMLWVVVEQPFHEFTEQLLIDALQKVTIK